MLEAMEILGLDNSLVQINFSQWFFVLHLDSACTNQLYPSALFVPCSKTLKIFYWNTQDFEVMTNPIDQDVMVKIRERIASFIMSQVINPKGEFHCDNPGFNYIWTKNVNCTMKDEPRAYRIWNLQDMKPYSVLVYVLSLILCKMITNMCCSCTMYDDDDDDDVYLCYCMFCQLCGVLCKIMNLCFCSNACSANDLC